MRRLLGAIVEERALGDMTTLEDGTSIEEAKRSYEELKAELKEVLASPPKKAASDSGRPAANESP
jgi:hypothetical protein